MAWFRRHRDEDTAAATEPEADFDASSFAPQGPRAPTPGDWQSMPPLARTIGPPPVRAASVQRLNDMMTTRRPLALIGSLGHNISPLAPSGSVDALAAAASHTPGRADRGPSSLPLREPHVPVPQSASAVASSFGSGAGDASGAVDESFDPSPLPSPVTVESLAATAPLQAPVVQRVMAATDAPVPPSLPTIARLPDVRASRTLSAPVSLPLAGQPQRELRPDAPAPTLRVVPPRALAAAATLPVQTLAASTQQEPDLEAEVDAPIPTVAPLAGDAPMDVARSIAPDPGPASDPDAEPVTTSVPGGTTIDLPLASRGNASGRELPEDLPLSTPPADLAPPIQPLAIQRRAVESAASRNLPATTSSRDETLPPLPAWARAPEPTPDPQPPTTSMPLQQPTVQRTLSAAPMDTSATAPEPTEDDSALVEDAAAADAAEVAPLLGAPMPGYRPERAQNEADEGPAGAPPAVVLPLHAAAPAHDDDRGEQQPVQRDAIAPLVGDRPIRTASGTRSTSSSPQSGGDSFDVPAAGPVVAAPGMPLAPDLARGPALQTPPARPAEPSAIAPSGDDPMTAQRTTTLLGAPMPGYRHERAQNELQGAGAAAMPLPFRTSPIPVVQRAAAMPLQTPARTTPEPSRANASATSSAQTIGDMAVAAGIATRSVDGSVVFTRQDQAPSDDQLPIQRVGIGEAAASAMNGAAPTEGGGSAGPAAGHTPEPQELDVLARRLFPHFRTLFAHELRTTRGRLGDGPWNRHR